MFNDALNLVVFSGKAVVRWDWAARQVGIGIWINLYHWLFDRLSGRAGFGVDYSCGGSFGVRRSLGLRWRVKELFRFGQDIAPQPFLLKKHLHHSEFNKLVTV
jgi:hypothetical protein